MICPPVHMYIDVENPPFVDEFLNWKPWVFHIYVNLYLYQILDEYGIHMGDISDYSRDTTTKRYFWTSIELVVLGKILEAGWLFISHFVRFSSFPVNCPIIQFWQTMDIYWDTEKLPLKCGWILPLFWFFVAGFPNSHCACSWHWCNRSRRLWHRSARCDWLESARWPLLVVPREMPYYPREISTGIW